MTDRERIAETVRHRTEALYDDVICPMCYRLNPQHETADNGKGCHWCQDKQDWLADAGYTRQPEPSPDRVEAMANYLWKMKFPTQDEWECNPFDDLPQETREDLFANARSILSLFPEPELKALESNPYNIGSWQGYICNQAYEKGKRDQLAHDQQQIKGE